MMRRTIRGLRILLRALAAIGLAGLMSPAAVAAPPEIIVGLGKSQVVDFAEPYADLMIADPKIADVLPLSPRSVYVVGRGLGATALTAFAPGKRLLGSTNVVVSPDLESLKLRLHELLPAERGIAVSAANQSIVISGTVSSPAVLQRTVALAESYAPGKIVNMLAVEGSQQIMLSVRFVEMERATAKNLRANVNRLPSNGDPSFSVFTGDTNVRSGGALVQSFGAVAATFNNNFEILLDALETKGLVRTLAEPNLVAMSGDTASFLAGGEFPIPVAQQGTAGQGTVPAITVAFKQFGVALAFTPTLLSNGQINIVVSPEVSSIDSTASLDLASIRVPGIKVRRARTTVELGDGESFMVAGLLKEDYQNEVRQFPFVGDVPVLGALFRSSGYQRNETELVIVVTPHLVAPRRQAFADPGAGFASPSDFELFVLGATDGRGRRLPAEDRALITTDPGKAGVDGPHGHVLY